uniref:Orf86 n=1 Tax=Globisporangium ultimum TaxID=2052682 RepID=E2DQZ8_GLOUL|nr:orf86 [Globisporangium ultimum]ACZ44485.1 orf86 [Globisporangium ultimum]
MLERKNKNKNNLNQQFIHKNNKYLKKKTYNNNVIQKKKPEKPKITNYLYVHKKLKKGVFLKKPSFNDIVYPFSLNLKLINEYLKKK